MKKLSVALTSAALASLIGFAQASPIQYQYTATHAYEFNADMTIASDYLFTDGTAITTTFYFDSEQSATATNQVDSGDLQPFGQYSAYDSISKISGQVAGYNFGADTGITLIANSNSGDATFLDGVFHSAGKIGGINISSGFSGFALDDFTLVSFGAYSVGSLDYLADQSLPVALTKGSQNTGVNLIFEDADHNRRTVAFWNGNVTPVTKVPEPASIWLLGAGLAGVIGFNRRRRSL